MGRINWKKIIFRIKLRFNKRMAKNILHVASFTVGKHCDMMCPSLHIAICYLYRVDLYGVGMEDLFRRYGFSRKNYHDFVRLKYPELTPYLERSSISWISIAKVQDEKVIQSKREFLKELSENL